MKKQQGSSFSPRRTQVSSRAFLNYPVTLHMVFKIFHDSQCVKSVQIRRFFWSVFSCIWAEYGSLRSISPYSMQENADQKNLRVWTLFTQYVDKVLCRVAHEYIESIFCSLLKKEKCSKMKYFAIDFTLQIQSFLLQKLQAMYKDNLV